MFADTVLKVDVETHEEVADFVTRTISNYSVGTKIDGNDIG